MSPYFEQFALRKGGHYVGALLLADTHPIRPQAHLTMISRATFDIERACVPSTAIGIKGILIWLLIVSIPRKLPSCAKANDTAARLHAFTSWRTVRIK
jgi:hypothetical protein